MDVQHFPSTHLRRRRVLGGYHHADVDAAIQELEWMNVQLTGELRLAEARATELQAELRATRAELVRSEAAKARCRELEASLRSARADRSRLEGAERRCRELEAELRSSEQLLEHYHSIEYSIGAALVAACQRAAEIERAAEAQARALLAEVREECTRLREAAVLQVTPPTRRDFRDGQRNAGLLASLREALESFMGYVDGRENAAAPPARARPDPPAILPPASVPGDGRSRDTA